MDESLGPVRYGIAMAVIAAGMFLGSLTTSIINIKTVKKHLVFASTLIISGIAWIIFPLVEIFPIMVGIMVIAGFLMPFFNVLFYATMQLTVPQEFRGKVFSLIGAISGGLVPIAYAVGGILAEFISVKIIIPASFFIILLIFMPIGFTASTRRFIGFDPEKETLEDIINI
jgi:MFS family permease